MKSLRTDVADLFDGLSKFSRTAHRFMVQRIRSKTPRNRNRHHADDRLRSSALRELKQKGILAVADGGRSPLSDHRSMLA